MNKKKRFHIPAWIIIVVIILITLEIAPFILSYPLMHQGFHPGEIRSEIGYQAQTEQKNSGDTKESKTEYLGEHILHPYLGYVHIPGDAYNRLGFPGSDPLETTNENTVNICISGGSVAKQLFQFEEKYFIEKLQTYQAFAGKDLRLFVIALGGYKQPQQLMALNYYMAQGARFDYVINLDGFNEIVLPLSDNTPFGVHPSFPRNWNIYSRKKLDSQVLLQMGREASLKEELEGARVSMQNSLLQYSNLALFFWKISDLNTKQKMNQAEMQLRKAMENVDKDIQATGPAYVFADTLSFLKQQADLWAQCSRQMEAVVERAGGKYIHFLQPNQYDEGSKPLSSKELKFAYESGSFAYKTIARKGYPVLRDEGNQLLKEGMHYVDLSRMFVTEHRTLYSDKCCHFNALGYRLIADRILTEIRNSLPQITTNH